MLYKATHTTRYLYDASVAQCQSEVRLTPRVLPWQTLLDSRIQTTPEPASVERHKDYFGNEVTSFTILESHDRFTTVATSVVNVEARPQSAVPDASWEDVRDELQHHAKPETLEAFEFVFDSPFVGTAPELAAYGRASFVQGRPLLAAVDDLMHRMHADFTYQPKATRIDTPILETLRSKRGVCQDFSHVMIGVLRSTGLAARYISGYLRSGANYQGAEASHAWVSVYVPGAGWVDVDPTNDVRPGTGHVTLGWGRDYGDVTPVKGLALGGGNQIVEVDVRVVPVDTRAV
jgi:transglutaminase-like putative cysteine protease